MGKFGIILPGHSRPRRLRPLSRRTEVLTVVALLALLTLPWLPRLAGPIDLRWDGAVYYTLGRSLAEGKGYRLLNEPGEIEATVWPPALPAFIAIHQKLLGTSDPVVVGIWLRRSFLILWIAFLAAAYGLLRTNFSVAVAAFGTSLCALHQAAVWLSDRLYADLPFALLVALTLLVHRVRARWTFTIWVLAALAFLTRTAGIALFAGWIAESLYRRQYRAATLRTALSLIPIVAWLAFINHVESSPAYQHPPYEYARADYALYNVSYTRNMPLRDPFFPELGRASAGELVQRVASNLLQVPRHLGGAVTGKESDWVAAMGAVKETAVIRRVVPWRLISVGLLTCGVLVLAGLVVRLVGGDVFLVAILTAYSLHLCLLPTTFQWPRYFFGVAPLVVDAFLAGLLTLKSIGVTTFGRPFLPSALASALAAFALVVQLYILQRAFQYDFGQVTHANWAGHRVDYRLFTYDASFEALDEGLDWLQRQERRPDAVSVSSMAAWVFVRTGWRSVMPPLERQSDRAEALLDSVPATYVIVDTCGFSLTREYALPLLQTSPSRWRLVHTVDGERLTIYRRTSS
jgi:hypothetical protein